MAWAAIIGCGVRLDQFLRHFVYVDDARAQIAAGSFADLQARMSAAAWHMAAGDLDGAIVEWTELMATEAAPLAAANLGRALLARGGPEDLREGRRLLGMATTEMPRDHPARAGVERALASLQA
jgi:hypothetical protein